MFKSVPIPAGRADHHGQLAGLDGLFDRRELEQIVEFERLHARSRHPVSHQLAEDGIGQLADDRAGQSAAVDMPPSAGHRDDPQRSAMEPDDRLHKRLLGHVDPRGKRTTDVDVDELRVHAAGSEVTMGRGAR